TRRFTLPITIKGDEIGITAVILDRRGDYTTLDLGEHGRGKHTPIARVPTAARAGRIVALRLRFPQIASFLAGHRESGTARAVGQNGIVPLHVEEQTIPGQIVGVSRYFPSVDGDFVVADLPTWLTAANTANPGTSTASELWVDSSAPPAVLDLDVTSQQTTLA